MSVLREFDRVRSIEQARGRRTLRFGIGPGQLPEGRGHVDIEPSRRGPHEASAENVAGRV